MYNLYSKIDNSFSYDEKLFEKFNIEEKATLIFEYISDFRSTKILRFFFEEFSKKIGIPNLWEKRLILIIDELNNNAIEYGTKEGDYNKLIININKQDSAVELNIEVEDKGNGKLPKNANEMEELRKKRHKNLFNNNSIRGRGLFMIIEKLVDKLYFKDSERGGLIVGIEKRLKLEN